MTSIMARLSSKLFSLAVWGALTSSGGAQLVSPADERHVWWPFAASNDLWMAQQESVFLPPSVVNDVIRRDHSRARALLERDRTELHRFYRSKGEQKIAGWRARWDIRDEKAARYAKERATLVESREAPSVGPEAETILEMVPSAARDIINRLPAEAAGNAVQDLIKGVSSTVEERVVHPISRHSRDMAPGYFALMLAGVFFVPSVGLASLVLAFASLRGRHFGRAFFFLFLSALCGAILWAAVENPNIARTSYPVIAPPTVGLQGTVLK
jgi:hypothetical protein